MRLILLMPLASLKKWYLTLMCFVFIDVLCFPVLDWIFGNCNCQLAFTIQDSGFLLNFTHVDENFSSSYCFICRCTCCNALKFHVDWATISCFLWKPWKYSISKKKKSIIECTFHIIQWTNPITISLAKQFCIFSWLIPNAKINSTLDISEWSFGCIVMQLSWLLHEPGQQVDVWSNCC